MNFEELAISIKEIKSAVRGERELRNNLLNYGDIRADIETEEKDGYRRIMVIRYNDRVHLLHLFNGEVIERFEV